MNTPHQNLSKETLEPLRLGKYLLLHRIGAGHGTEVYLARVLDPHSFERLIAVKRVLPSVGGTEVRGRLENEAKFGNLLTHPNVVHVYDFGEYEGSCLLAMEFVNGKSLADIIERARSRGHVIPPALALSVLAQVASGLDYAHHRKDDATASHLHIFHGAISTKSIMMSFDGETKIAGFGNSKGMASARGDVQQASEIISQLLPGGAQESDGELREIIRRGFSGKQQYETASQLRDALSAYLTAHHIFGVREEVASFLHTLYGDEIASRREIIERVSTQPQSASKPIALPLRQSPLPLPIAQAPLPRLEKMKYKHPIGWRVPLVLALTFGSLGYVIFGDRDRKEATPKREREITSLSKASDSPDCGKKSTERCQSPAGEVYGPPQR